MRKIDAAVRDGIISPIEAHAWTLIDEGCRSVNELAEWMDRSPKQVGRYINKLIAAGYVQSIDGILIAVCPPEQEEPSYPQDEAKNVPIDDPDQDQVINNINRTNTSQDSPPEWVYILAQGLCDRVFGDRVAVDNLAQRLWEVLRGTKMLEWTSIEGWLERLEKIARRVLIQFEDVEGRIRRGLHPVRNLYAYFCRAIHNEYLAG